MDDLTTIINPQPVSQTPIKVVKSKSTTTEDDYYVDNDTDKLQYDDDETDKDELEERFHRGNMKQEDLDHLDIETNSSPSSPRLGVGHIAVIVAICTVIACISIYAGLILWRKKMEIKYGTPHRLMANDYNDGTVYCDRNADESVPDLEV